VDVLLTDADIITMAAGAGPARSMLVRDDRVVAVGPAERVRAAAPDARVVRLEGAAVIPGLIDAHCHLCNVGYLASGADCSQPGSPDIPAVLARLRDAAARTPEGSWVTGSGYVEYSSARAGIPPALISTPPCRTGRRSCFTPHCTPVC
jgi:predicted amidohydrolase YtcJ